MPVTYLLIFSTVSLSPGLFKFLENFHKKIFFWKSIFRSLSNLCFPNYIPFNISDINRISFLLMITFSLTHSKLVIVLNVGD